MSMLVARVLCVVARVLISNRCWYEDKAFRVLVSRMCCLAMPFFSTSLSNTRATEMIYMINSHNKWCSGETLPWPSSRPQRWQWTHSWRWWGGLAPDGRTERERERDWGAVRTTSLEEKEQMLKQWGRQRPLMIQQCGKCQAGNETCDFCTGVKYPVIITLTLLKCSFHWTNTAEPRQD